MKNFRTLLLLGMAFTSACSQPADVEQVVSPRPTKLHTVEASDAARMLRLPATVEASEQTALGFQVSGQLTRLNFSEGSEIKKGQVLAQLDQRDFQNALASAQAEFDIAQSEFERAERLFSQDAVAKSVLDQRRARRDTTKAALDIARKQLTDTVLRAPFDGIVSDIRVEAFETVSPQQPVFTLSSYGQADAVIQVPASIMINSDFVRPTNVTVELDAAPGVLMPANFREGVAVADPGTQTFEVRYSFTPPTDLVVLPGMTGVLNGTLARETASGLASNNVPATAIVAESGQTFVWVVELESMTVSRRDVTVGPGQGDLVTILDGVGAGDTIVSAGGPYLYEGAEIRAFNGKG